MTHKKLIAGNWKMNGDLALALTLTREIVAGVERDPALLQRCDFLICPPLVHLARVRANLGATPLVMLGAQDCSAHAGPGAFTGDVSASMLEDCGVGAVILGHSERRTLNHETSALVAQKAACALDRGLTAVICVGESETEREQGAHFDVVARQISESLHKVENTENIVVAYEPVWAIGTGKAATPDDVQAMHEFIRTKVGNSRILYGGSVKPENAGQLLNLPNVDGALIGGASLKAESYLGIAKAV